MDYQSIYNKIIRKVTPKSSNGEEGIVGGR
jgi:hypothetical protein